MPPSSVDANRREIASAACELVADGGLDSVSMRRIAKHLGATTGYISHYYADKEDLLEAALRAALSELTAGSAPRSTTCLLYTSPSPRDRTRSRMPSSA